MSEDVAGALAPPARAERALAAWIAGWVAGWLAAFGVFKLALIPAGAGMFGRSWVAGAFFLGAAALAARVTRRELAPERAAAPGAGPLLAVAGALALTAALGLWAERAWPLAPEAWERYRAHQIGVARMDLVYHAVKLPELVFQQAMILALTRRLLRHGLSGARLVGAFALVFGALHLPLVALQGLAGLPFVVAATASALVFPLLIARRPWGVAYAFCVHLLAYVAAGTALRLAG